MSADRLQRDTNVRQVHGQDHPRFAGCDLRRSICSPPLARLSTAATMPRRDAALGRVERQAVTIQSGTRPACRSCRALENLDLARVRVAEGKYKDARMPLEIGRPGACGVPADEGQPPRRTSAEIMRTEMDAYADKIGRDHSDAARLIEDWYDTVKDWYTAMTG